MLDINHDGKVNADEMKSMLQKIGISVCDQTVNQLLSDASKNGMIFILYEKTFHFWFEISFNSSINEKNSFHFCELKELEINW